MDKGFLKLPFTIDTILLKLVYQGFADFSGRIGIKKKRKP